MRWWNMVAVRARALFQRRANDAELDAEIRYHIERDVSRRVALGASEADARVMARRAFGNVTLITEQARAASRVDAVERLWQDTRYALRGFRRSPRFALTVVLTIGLGIGLLTSAFTIFNAYVLRLFAVRDPQSLYEMQLHDRFGRDRNVTWSEFQALARDDPAFVERFASLWLVAHRDGEPTMFWGVSGDFFRMLGVRPALGRVLDASDVTSPGSAPVLVLSHRAWQTKFGADSSVLGRRLRFGGRSFEIVGVAQEGFDGLSDTPPDFWVPITMAGVLSDAAARSDRDTPMFKVVGRLAPGLSAPNAERALAAWASAMTADGPEARRVASVTLESRATPFYMSPTTIAQLSPLFVAFAAVLLIACANVANMMLARGMARQREIGIRLALGASRRRLVTQLMTEALLLAVPAGVVGFVVSRVAVGGAVKAMFATAPASLSAYLRVLPLGPDGRLYTFLVVSSVVAAIAFGLAPALQTTRTNVIEATRGEIAGLVRSVRLRNALVVAQVTVCALLLIAGSILLRGGERLQTLNMGFRSNGVVEVYPPRTLRAAVLERLRTDPATRVVAASSHAPLGGRFRQILLGSGGGANSEAVQASAARVSPGYFDALGVNVLRGRAFTEEDAASADALVIVSDATARRLWPGGSAIGKEVTLASPYGTATRPRTAHVVGVAGDVVTGFVGERRDHPTVYEVGSVGSDLSPIVVATKSAGPQAKIAVQSLLARIDPDGAIEIHTLDESVDSQLYPFRVAHWIASALGVIALVLTMTGIYAVLAYVVALREKEIGIRLALGATRRMVVGLVVRQSVRLALIGTLVGAVLALGAARFVASHLTMIPAFDAGALAVGVLTVFAAALVAAYVPSRRAANVDPGTSLRL